MDSILNPSQEPISFQHIREDANSVVYFFFCSCFYLIKHKPPIVAHTSHLRFAEVTAQAWFGRYLLLLKHIHTYILKRNVFWKKIHFNPIVSKLIQYINVSGTQFLKKLFSFLYLIKSQALLEGLYFNSRAGKVFWIYWDKVKSQVSEQLVWTFSLTFFNFKDTIKELHDVPFFSYEHKTYSNMESGIISKPAFFSYFTFWGWVGFRETKIGWKLSDIQSNRGLDIWKEHKSLNWRLVLVSFVC